ncbi:MAG TPA: exodeoxyribonuclease VII large subunit [Hymenobacter sp.]
MDQQLFDLGSLPDQHVSVTDLIDLLNESYEYAFPSVVVAGELANLRISRGRWVYFDLKDDQSSLKCFATVQHLPGPLEDGMLLEVRGAPHMHNLYGFSFNVQFLKPAGEGSLRRAAELLQAKLKAEGLFDAARKRPLPYPPERIGLITSLQSAAYADFTKILAARWGGLQVDVIDTQVQGDGALPQIINAINRFNELADPPEVLVLIRGGGSADDLAVWSHEHVTRAVAASRIPTLAAIGHEVDSSLAELAADLRASTPSNAAELLTPGKQQVLDRLREQAVQINDTVRSLVLDTRSDLGDLRSVIDDNIRQRLRSESEQLGAARQLLEALSPQAALRRGYAVLRDADHHLIGGTSAVSQTKVGAMIYIETARQEFEAEITRSTAKPPAAQRPAPTE